MKILPIEAYDALEQQAMCGLSIPEMMAFRPVTFEQVGYPTRVRQEGELARYVDHNFEAEVPRLFEDGAVFPPIGYVNAFTQDERQHIDRVRDKVASLTFRSFGHPMRPICNLMVQMGPYRAMNHLAHYFNLQPLSVFEVGPGMAYLGALLAQAGHRYWCYDVTQALYLWQNRLLAEIADNDFLEMVINSHPEQIANARVAHVPWWEYVKFLSDSKMQTDIVYSNSNLGEISPLALKHVLQISNEMLKESKLGLFMYFSTGMCAQNTPEALAAGFEQYGYHKVFESPFVGYVLNQDRIPEVRTAFQDGLPHINPSQSDFRLSANEVMSLRRAEAPLDVQLTTLNYGWVPPFLD